MIMVCGNGLPVNLRFIGTSVPISTAERKMVKSTIGESSSMRISSELIKLVRSRGARIHYVLWSIPEKARIVALAYLLQKKGFHFG
jgi:hypothetical protein